MITMRGIVLVCLIVEAVLLVRCEPSSMNTDQSIVHGIAAKIGFPPTVLKVFIKGDIQADEIEKLLSLCTRQDKGPNDSDLARNRRNSISDYLGKLYSFNNVFRPYRSIFRGFKHVQTTRIPWIRKFLKSIHEEPRTESFWGMALGAHTFSPFARPLARTRIPYHRIRNQQRINRFLGITKGYGNILPVKDETIHNQWMKNENKLDQILARVMSDETTTAVMDWIQNATTRNAFHKGPLDVAGLRTITLPHLHATATPRRLKFCEKQCVEEPEKAKTKRPGTTGISPSSAGGENQAAQEMTNCDRKSTSEDRFVTTGQCTCTVDARGKDYLFDWDQSEKDYKGKANIEAPVPKPMAQSKLTTYHHTTYKPTTSKFTRSKDRRPTGAVWTLPPNAVLDQAKTTEEQRRLPVTTVLPEDMRETMEYTASTKPQPNLPDHAATTILQPNLPGHAANPDQTSVSTGTENPWSTCKHGRLTKPMLCIPMPIPTRIKIPICPHHRTTRQCSRKTTTAEESTSTPDMCKCHSSAPTEDIPISVDNSLDNNRNPSECKGKPQKIIVRISSSLGEVPVVIMRDNGVSGVSLSLVNDYLLDENNRLIKCLGQKPLRGRMELRKENVTRKTTQTPNAYKCRHFLPHLIRHQLHGMQKRPYSFRVNYDPSHRLISRPKASLGKGNGILSPALNRPFSNPGYSNQFLSYQLDSQNPPMHGFGSLGSQYPSSQNTEFQQSFKMKQVDPPLPRIGPVDLSIPQMDFNGYSVISPTGYPRFKMHPGLSGFELSGLNLPPMFPGQMIDTSQYKDYRQPFLPIFYPNNVLQNV